MNFLQRLYLKTKTSIVFFFVMVSDTLVYLFYRYQLETESLYRKSLSSKLSYDQLEKLISSRSANYFFAPLTHVFTFAMVTLIITGIVTFGLYLFDYAVNFKATLKAVLVGKFVFVAMSIVNGIYFLFYRPENLLEIRHRNLLSAQLLFDYDSLSATEASALGAVNVFEFAFMLLTATCLAAYYKKSDSTELFFRIILGTYGLSFLVLTLIKIYFSMNTR